MELRKIDVEENYDEIIENPVKENKMGYMPINKLLITMALPVIISSLVQALYNMVDSIFVAKIGETALSAMSVAFPAQVLVGSLAGGTGIGINFLLSKALGEKNKKSIQTTVNNSIILMVVSYILVAILGFFFSRAFFEMQTNNIEIIEYGTTYLSVCLIFSFGVVWQNILEKFLQSTGKTGYILFTHGIGTVINLVLDPILIFGLIGFPAMGIKGAAVATVIGQIVGMLAAVYINMKKNHEIHPDFKNFKVDFKTIKEIYRIGIPSFLMNSLASVAMFCINGILISFTATATAVYGVYYKLYTFVIMPAYGLNAGIIPIVAYNYGAKKKNRIKEAAFTGIKYILIFTCLGFLIFQLFPKSLLQMFSASEEMMALGLPALRLLSIGLLFTGISIISCAVFQALGNAMYSLMVSINRQLLFVLPIAFIGSKLFGLNAVWISLPIAEFASMVVSLFLLKRIFREKLSNL